MRALVTFKRGRDTWKDKPITIKRIKPSYQVVACDYNIDIVRHRKTKEFILENDGGMRYFTGFLCVPITVDPPSFTYNFILQVKPAIKTWLLIANRYHIVKDVERIIANLLMDSKHDRVWLNIPST